MHGSQFKAEGQEALTVTSSNNSNIKKPLNPKNTPTSNWLVLVALTFFWL